MASSAPRRYRRVRTPTVLQMEAAECGAAALGIILEYHGRYVPLDVLRDECGVSRDGSNAFYIKEAAKRYGLEVKAVPQAGRGPADAAASVHRLLAVEPLPRRRGIRAGKVYLNDPASRPPDDRRWTNSSAVTAASRSPSSRVLEFVKQGRRPSALLGLVRRLSTSKAALVFVILAGLALVIPNLVSAAFQRVFIDEILVEGHHDWLKPLLLAMVLTAVMRLAAAGLEQVYLTRLEVRLTLDESLKFLWHVLRLPIAFFQRRFTGDIVSRASSTARVAGLISGELATTAVSLLTLVVYVAVMLPYDPLLTIVGVGISSLNLVALKWFSR